MKKFSLWLSSILLSTQALAAPKLFIPPSYCIGAKSLMAKSRGCEDNALFTGAAQLCVKKIENEAKSLGIDIKSLQRIGTNNQKGDMKLAAKEYFELSRKLDYMIGVTEVSRIDTYNYIEHLYLPEDEADDPAENMNVPCFGDNVRALETIADQLDKKQAEFEAVLELTKKQLLETQGNSVNMGSVPATPSAADLAAPAKPAPTPQAKDWKASGISVREKNPAKK